MKREKTWHKGDQVKAQSGKHEGKSGVVVASDSSITVVDFDGSVEPVWTVHLVLHTNDC